MILIALTKMGVFIPDGRKIVKQPARLFCRFLCEGGDCAFCARGRGGWKLRATDGKAGLRRLALSPRFL